MNETIRYIRLEEVYKWLAMGWKVCSPGLAGTPHGQYSEMLYWRNGEWGTPKEPK